MWLTKDFDHWFVIDTPASIVGVVLGVMISVTKCCFLQACIGVITANLCFH